MSARLENKTAVVTGAGSGIGRAIATRFIEEGATVIYADIDERAVTAAVHDRDSSRAHACRVDISDEDSVIDLFSMATEVLGRVDVVVAHAGIQLFGRDAPLADLTLEAWNQTIAVNLTGTFLTMKHALRAMSGSGGSLIVTGSPTALTGALGAGFGAYGTSKAGAHALSRIAAFDYAKVGIRVNTVVPGYTETPLVAQLSNDSDARTRVLAGVPLGRPGTPRDVEGIMVYLASDDSAFATGATFVVDGGASGL